MQHIRRRLVAGCAAGALTLGGLKSTAVACDEPNNLFNVHLNDIPHIKQWCTLRHPLPSNPLKRTGDSSSSSSVRDKKFVSMDPPEMVIQDIVTVSKPDGSAHAFRRAGPHEHIVWDAHEVKAAIVTCGGLSPGLNNVIRGIVKTLHDTYGVPRTSVLGVQFG
jgi:6-phosphofructokinase 1